MIWVIWYACDISYESSELCKRGVLWSVVLWRDHVMRRESLSQLLAVRGLCEDARRYDAPWRKCVMSCGNLSRLIAVCGVCEVVRSCEELWRNCVMSCGNLLRLIAVRGLCKNAHNFMKLWRKRVMNCNYLSAPFWNFFVLCILYRILKFISWSAHKLRRNVKVPKNRRGKFFSSPRHR